MRQTAVMLAVTLAVGLAVVMLGNQAFTAQQEAVTRTILQQKDLEGVQGRESIMYRADIIPGGVAGKHFHPGPELVYVLEGSLTLELDGQAPLTLKAGESAHIPAKHIHNARNPSTTAPARVLVVLIGEKGQPLATVVQ